MFEENPENAWLWHCFQSLSYGIKTLNKEYIWFRYEESWDMLREILLILYVTSVISPPPSAVPLNLP